MVGQQSARDQAIGFEQLWGLTQELRQKIDDRFELHPDPSTTELQHYASSDGTSQGSLNTFSGNEIDWLVHSWLRNPASGFCNMHLTAWLGSQIRVPHLAFAFATVPYLFFYMDYIPRTDLFTDLDYLDRYYEAMNPTYLALQADTRFTPYISKTLYIRQAQSHTSLCYTCPVSEDTLAVLRTISHEMMDRWLTWIDQAPPTPDADRPVLSQRDQIVRRAIAERDPDNQIAVRLFGSDMTEKLVRALWGGDRTP
jgi:hypothetical protein